MEATKDGFISWGKGHKTYYKIIGAASKSKYPLLVLNGGPGSPHNYMLDLKWLAKDGRQVIFYDQVGCGQSSRITNKALMSPKLYINEISAVRKKLKLKNVHILGHSWGGMLAIEYALTKPKGVRSLVLASSMISMPMFKREMRKLRLKLPLKIQLDLRKSERSGNVDNPSYKAAYTVFSKRHIFRQDSWPQHLGARKDSFGRLVYQTMWGLSECYPNGNLANWDKTPVLQEITLPTLITSGHYDELTPKQAKLTHRLIPNSKQVIFEHSAHLAHIEEPAKFNKTMEKFLQGLESL